MPGTVLDTGMQCLPNPGILNTVTVGLQFMLHSPSYWHEKSQMSSSQFACKVTLVVEGREPTIWSWIKACDEHTAQLQHHENFQTQNSAIISCPIAPGKQKLTDQGSFPEICNRKDSISPDKSSISKWLHIEAEAQWEHWSVEWKMCSSKSRAKTLTGCRVLGRFPPTLGGRRTAVRREDACGLCPVCVLCSMVPSQGSHGLGLQSEHTINWCILSPIIRTTVPQLLSVPCQGN